MPDPCFHPFKVLTFPTQYLFTTTQKLSFILKSTTFSFNLAGGKIDATSKYNLNIILVTKAKQNQA
jgi:hypothetical protein